MEHFHVALTAVAVQNFGGRTLDDFSGRQFPKQEPVVIVEASRSKAEHIPAEHFGTRPSESLLGARIPIRDHALGIHFDKGIEGAIEKRAQRSIRVTCWRPALAHVYLIDRRLRILQPLNC